MSGKCFIDTNVLLYIIDERVPVKKQKAKELLTDLITSNSAMLSTQSLQEFINASIEKFNYSKEVAAKSVDFLSEKITIYQNSLSTIKHALQISIKTQFSFWDSLILAAAIESGCSIFYSEDLSNGQIVDGVEIVNPFV